MLSSCDNICFNRKLRRYRIRVGDYFKDDGKVMNEKFASVEDVQEYNISEIYKHNDFTSHPSARNDIVLIKLEGCANLGSVLSVLRRYTFAVAKFYSPKTDS